MAFRSRSSRVAAWWMILSLSFAAGALAAQEQPAKPKPPPARAKAVKASKGKPKSSPGKAKASKTSPAASAEKAAGRQDAQAQGKHPRCKRPKKARGDEEQTLVLRLGYVPAERMAHHVKRLFSGPEPVRVSADEPGNILLVRAQPEVLDQVRHMVDLLEDAAAKSARRGERSVRVFRLEFADAQRVGSLIAELAPFSPHGPPPQVEWDLRTNALLINAGRQDWPEIETVIAAVDVRE